MTDLPRSSCPLVDTHVHRSSIRYSTLNEPAPQSGAAGAAAAHDPNRPSAALADGAAVDGGGVIPVDVAPSGEALEQDGAAHSAFVATALSSSTPRELPPTAVSHEPERSAAVLPIPTSAMLSSGVDPHALTAAMRSAAPQTQTDRSAAGSRASAGSADSKTVSKPMSVAVSRVDDRGRRDSQAQAQGAQRPMTDEEQERFLRRDVGLGAPSSSAASASAAQGLLSDDPSRQKELDAPLLKPDRRALRPFKTWNSACPNNTRCDLRCGT
jgi:hypothetical protein